jgi:ADP-heptose:LPS heptosyltransferase
LPELTEWLRASSVVVTNDSGPMHVAAAVGTPVIALFGPTSASKTGPYDARGTVLTADSSECSACARGLSYRAEGHDCMRSIAPAQVAAAVMACE